MKKLFTLLSIVLLSATLFAQNIATLGLPPGITLNTSGLLSGTPTAAGTYQFTVQVCDSETPAQCASAPLTLVINSPIVITTTTLPQGAQGIPYSFQLGATGGVLPYSWTAK